MGERDSQSFDTQSGSSIRPPYAISRLWNVVAGVSILALVGMEVAERMGTLHISHLPISVFEMLAALVAIALISWRWRMKDAQQSGSSLASILDSAAPMILSLDLNGFITYINPALERTLGYKSAELVGRPAAAEILAEGEGPRLVAEVQRLNGLEPNPELSSQERLHALLETVSRFPAGQSPCFEIQLRRKDHSLFPVMLHVSALRNAQGEMKGLVAVAVDVSETMHHDQADRESQEPFRDLFENSSEMIATLSPEGKFLYANPAWKCCFGLNQSALLELHSFDDLFGPDCRYEVAAFFRRALGGESIDRVALRNHTLDGRVLEFELSLSKRQRAGHPLAVRCLMRDVTQQRQREHRLALQLVVSQIVGENVSPEIAATRMLETLCISQGWDMAVKWEVNLDEQRLDFCAGWAAPGTQAEDLLQQTTGRSLEDPNDLSMRVWLDGRPVWITDLSSGARTTRAEAAIAYKMASGWAAPVKVGNKLLGVLEFYSHLRLRENHEALAAIEVVASSLGQMLASTRERGRVEGLYRQQEILLNAVADCICGIDKRGFVSFANPAAGRVLGAPTSRMIGKSIHDLLHGANATGKACGEECALRRATLRQLASAGEDTLYRADGTAFPAEYFFTPILDQGRFSGSVLSFRDISQRYALDRMKDEFISTVSHELRTPLTSIRGALGLLTSGILGEINDKAANLLRIAVTNSDRLVRLINDILDLERIQSGREPITFRPMHLSEVIRQAIDGMQPVAEAAGVTLLHDTSQVEIHGDPDRLLQVLTNLLSNAVKFSPADSSVSIITRPGQQGVTLSVVDQGRGIPADKLEAIFGRFQQVDASDSRQKGGSGLGLAICRTIVAQHSGRIWAERNPVHGSTFRVYLPYKPAPSTLLPSAPLVDLGTVLLADANRTTRPLVVEKLARHGYRVLESNTVEQTMAALRDGVQAVLLDTSLDGMNGWEILPMLRRMDAKYRVPVVLLSMANTSDLPTEAEGLVVKPIREDELLNELARVLCGPGEKARILIIEDDRDLAGVIADVFARESIDVRLAYTRQSALDLCFSFQPHLLVLDIGLPDGDGFNVVDWLRQHENLSNLPLVVYSGRDLGPEERRQLTLGPTHFLTKARVQPQQLEALVLTLLRNSRQMEEAPPVAADRTV